MGKWLIRRGITVRCLAVVLGLAVVCAWIVPPAERVLAEAGAGEHAGGETVREGSAGGQNAGEGSAGGETAGEENGRGENIGEGSAGEETAREGSAGEETAREGNAGGEATGEGNAGEGTAEGENTGEGNTGAGAPGEEAGTDGEKPAERVELPERELYAKSCALIDGDSGRLLYGKDEANAMANASTTKIMTCILALESGKSEELVTVSENAAAQPKVHLGMQAGEQFYMLDLLYGLMLESYNDCAVAIAEHVAGSVGDFAVMMNEKAKELGCQDTHFVTPNGLDAEDETGEHHTTAYDLCLIMRYCAWESPESGAFLALTQTRSYTFSDQDGSSYTVNNHNHLLDMMDNAVTGKTGFTSKAGYCYVAAVEDGGRRYCIALLACGWPNNKNYKWADAKKLFGYGLEHYHLYTADETALDLEAAEVGSGCKTGRLAEWGRRASLALYVDNGPDTMTFLKADWDDAGIRREFVNKTVLPVHEGDVLGKIYYQIGGEDLYSYDICAGEEIREWTFERFLGAVWEEFLVLN